MTATDLIIWIIRTMSSSRYNYKFIKKRIRIHNEITTKKEKYLLNLFSYYYIGNDGVFIMRLIEHNSNAAVVSELIKEMWMQFKIEQDR